jgi:serine/threonine protein kinase
MEIIEGKSFEDYMCKTKFGPKTMPFFLDCIRQIACAIAHIHSNRIIHRDIKPANFLVIQKPDGTIHIKIIDFGLSNTFDMVDQETKGTPFFMSPEVVEWSEIDKKCDIWAFGVLILLILTRDEIPSYLKGNESSDKAMKIIKNLKANPFPVKLTEHKNTMIRFLANLAKRCLEINKSIRPSAAEIVEHLLSFKEK